MEFKKKSQRGIKYNNIRIFLQWGSENNAELLTCLFNVQRKVGQWATENKLLSSTIMDDFLIYSRLLILMFPTSQREKIKCFANPSKHLKMGKCQGPHQEMHMQAVSQLLMKFINKLRDREKGYKVGWGRKYPQAKKGNQSACLF